MDDITKSLREAFEADGHEVREVSPNRGRVRVVLPEGGLAAERLRPVVEDALDEGTVLGVNVTTESVEGGSGMATVVTVRTRS